MNYENMWNRLKSVLVERPNDEENRGERRVWYNDVLLKMSRIEAEEHEKASKAGEQTHTVHQNITERIDIKAPDMKNVTRKMLEQITGVKIIDNLADLEKAVHAKREGVKKCIPILVDVSLYIPKELLRDISERGLNVAQVEVDTGNVFSIDTRFGSVR